MSKANLNKEKFSFPEGIQIMGHALYVSYKARGKVSVLVSILGFVMAFVPMLLSSTLRTFTDSVQALFDRRVPLEDTLSLFAVLAILYILQLLFNGIRSYYVMADTKRIQYYIKEHVLRCVCSVRFKYIENYDDFQAKIAFADTYAGYEVAQSMQEVVVWVQNLITFVSLSIILIPISPWILVAIVVTSFPGIIISYFQEKEKYYKNKEWSRTQAFIHQYFHDCTRLGSLQEVRYLHIFPYIKGKWRKTADDFAKLKDALNGKHTIANGIADLIRGSVFIMILAIVAIKIYHNPAVGLGAFMLVISVTGHMQEITAQLFSGATQFISNLRYMKDFFDLEKLEYEEKDIGDPAPENAEICFEGVDFAYPNTNMLVLKDINVTIRQGEKVAIVGKNGSGKSTFINLLCAMYEPIKGKIIVGGKNTSENAASIRRAISTVFQEFGRYEDTIRFNITVSDHKRRISEEKFEKLCIQTGVYDFIKEQPNGFDEIIGSFSRKGTNVSGGQWQKIAITRAIYRDNTKIMILDEPTAALDPIAEANLYRNFASLTDDKTTILISHRLGITSIVDRVLVFDEGRIVEDGSHDELMKEGGLYAEMYRSQAQWYN